MKFRSLLDFKSICLTKQLQPLNHLNGLLGHIFENPQNNEWLPLLGNNPRMDLMIFGSDLGRLYQGQSYGLGDYLVLEVLNRPEPGTGWFEAEFLTSLRPHQRLLDTNEVVFESGLILNVASILEEPRRSPIIVERLVRKHLFGYDQTWYFSYSRSFCRRTVAEINGDTISIYVDMPKLFAQTHHI